MLSAKRAVARPLCTHTDRALSFEASHEHETSALDRATHLLERETYAFDRET